jgi:hypothetical protein
VFEARWIENAMLAWRYGMFAKAEHDIRLLAERRGDEIDPKDIFSAWKLKIDYKLQAIMMFLTIFTVLFATLINIVIIWSSDTSFESSCKLNLCYWSILSIRDEFHWLYLKFSLWKKSFSRMLLNWPFSHRIFLCI